MCVIKYKFNVLVNAPLASINTNYTLLAPSSSTSIILTYGTTDKIVNDAMAADATPGKKKLYKNFIYNEFTFPYASSYIEKMDRNVTKYSSHILRYINIY